VILYKAVVSGAVFSHYTFFRQKRIGKKLLFLTEKERKKACGKGLFFTRLFCIHDNRILAGRTLDSN